MSQTSKGISPINVLKLAGAYCAFCIGSGYASGQEVSQFFTSQGLLSFGALAISMALFMWFGSTIMMRGFDLNIKSTNNIFREYCGKYIGMALEIFIPIFLFSVVVIMVAGSGATLSEYYGMNPYVGRVLMAAAATVTVFFGLSRLVTVIGIIGPVIIVISLVVGVLGILHGTVEISNVESTMANLEVPKASSNWAMSGLLYAAYMVMGSAPFFAGLGTQANTRKEALVGGLLGGFLLIGAAVVMSTGMLMNIDTVFNKEVPALAMAGATAPWIADVFAVVLMLGIYSTAAPMLWSACNRLALDGTPRFKIAAVVLGVAAFIGGQLPFGQLVGFIYPNMGKLGILFLVCVLLAPFIFKNRKK